MSTEKGHVVNNPELRMPALKQTCRAMPEQYDAYLDGEVVGYLRLRHGHFTVQMPDASGVVIYEADTMGDGQFEEAERDHHLWAARLLMGMRLSARQPD